MMIVNHNSNSSKVTHLSGKIALASIFLIRGIFFLSEINLPMQYKLFIDDSLIAIVPPPPHDNNYNSSNFDIKIEN